MLAMSYDSLRNRVIGPMLVPSILTCLLIIVHGTAHATEPNETALAGAYRSEIRPLMERYCHDCHGEGATVLEGDINLAAIGDWAAATKQPRTWQKVAEMLGNELMPPQDAEQPTEAERSQLQKWVADFLTIQARVNAAILEE
jgi:uncharacterized membrane protein